MILNFREEDMLPAMCKCGFSMHGNKNSVQTGL